LNWRRSRSESARSDYSYQSKKSSRKSRNYDHYRDGRKSPSRTTRKRNPRSQSAPVYEFDPETDSRSLTARSYSTSAPLENLHGIIPKSTSSSQLSTLAYKKKREQIRKLQSYKPRVSFEAVSIPKRPLGVKLCSNDGRYLEIVDVDVGSAGDRAGMQPGDLIVQINDDCFESAREGLMMVKSYPLPLILIVRRVLVENEAIEDGHSSAAGGSSTIPDNEHPSPQSSQLSLLNSPGSIQSDKSNPESTQQYEPNQE